jgi:hypothetical protein
MFDIKLNIDVIWDAEFAKYIFLVCLLYIKIKYLGKERQG